MVLRIPALQAIADHTGEGFVTLENHVRNLTKAPVPYSTALGRGNRDEHLSNKWLLSASFAVLVGDAKNAATKVPIFGDMRLVGTRFERRVEEIDGNKLNPYAPSRRTIDAVPANGLVAWAQNRSLFEAIANLVDICARDWNGEIHQQVHNSFELTVRTSPKPWAEIVILHSIEKGVTFWSRSTYLPALVQDELPYERIPAPYRRLSAIDGPHITMLALLWADTLKHQEAGETKSKPPAADSGEDHAMKSATPENENAAPARAARSRNYPDPDSNPSSVGRTSDDTRERESAQAVSNCGSGRSLRSSRIPTYGPSEPCSARPAFA